MADYTDDELKGRMDAARARMAAGLPVSREKIQALWAMSEDPTMAPGSPPAKYTEYLKCPQWKLIRRLAIEAAGGRCRLCNSTKAIEVHHRTYERVYHERLDDLTVLCGECHGKYHGKEGAL